MLIQNQSRGKYFARYESAEWKFNSQTGGGGEDEGSHHPRGVKRIEGERVYVEYEEFDWPTGAVRPHWLPDFCNTAAENLKIEKN